jgi:protein-S-isoprenylcysteine O-methyltransferase Ste14
LHRKTIELCCADVDASAPYNKTLGRIRLCALFLAAALLVVLARPTPFSVTIGFVFVAAGEAMRLWAAGHLRKTVELVTSGPYRYTRNPLYLGRLLVFTGLCVMARLPFELHWIVLLVGYAVFFGYYLPRKERVEPARLRETHGEPYERYFRAVPALIPTLRPYPDGTSIGWSSERMLRNKEPWMVVTLLGVSLLLLWVSYVRPEGLLLSWLRGS